MTWTTPSVAPQTHGYQYDATGNLLTDSRNGVTAIDYISYNDMPQSITNGSGTKTYRYDGTGSRVAKQNSSSDIHYYLDGVVLNAAGEVKSYQTADGYAVPYDNSGVISIDYFYYLTDWLGTVRGVLDDNGATLNANDHYPFGLRLPGRAFVSSSAEGERYQFTGHSLSRSFGKFDGETNYEYHGARYYNRELGRYMNTDRYAEKFYHQSPYVYAGDMPITAVDVNGDSVLFYSQSGEYLGYSHDNQRYKNKNLVSIIDDRDVENFNRLYKEKRNAEYSSDNAREAYVAGLEGMGTTYDVTEITNFIDKYSTLVGTNKENAKESNFRYDEFGTKFRFTQEWGAWMVNKPNPVVSGKNNWVGIDESTIVTDQEPYVFMPTIPDGAKSWLHLHTETSKKSSFSTNDYHTMRQKSTSAGYKGVTFWVGQVQPSNGGVVYHYYHPTSTTGGVGISFDKKSFQNAK